MAKTKLKLKKEDLKKFKVAAEFADLVIKLDDVKALGIDVLVPVSYRNDIQLFEAGRLMGVVLGTELDTPKK